MEMQTLQLNANTISLIIHGNMDAEGSRSAQPYIDSIIDDQNKTEIEVDFKDVQFLDSSGIGALVYLYKRLVERNRQMRIENVSGQPLEIMNLLRISQAIPVNSKLH